MNPIWKTSCENKVLEQNEVHVWRVSLACTDQKTRGLVSHGALRQILARTLKTAADDLRFSVDANGKPSLIGNSLHFNLSHTEDWALIALAENSPVGVDVEKIRDTLKAEEIARRFFAPAEVATLAALPDSKKSAFFFECWTQKEAHAKALGLGLSHLFDRQAERDLLFTIKKLDVAPGYCAAVAAEGTDWEVVCLDF
jgi:4'-phosphopantetheinyl transferase